MVPAVVANFLWYLFQKLTVAGYACWIDNLAATYNSIGSVLSLPACQVIPFCGLCQFPYILVFYRYFDSGILFGLSIQ